MVHKFYEICCVFALRQQTCKKKILFQTIFFASHNGIRTYYFHQAEDLPLPEQLGVVVEKMTVCASKDFLLKQQICWN